MIVDNGFDGACAPMKCPFHPKRIVHYQQWKLLVNDQSIAQVRKRAKATLSLQCGGCHQRLKSAIYIYFFHNRSFFFFSPCTVHSLEIPVFPLCFNFQCLLKQTITPPPPNMKISQKRRYVAANHMSTSTPRGHT
jgi:hypothetical protein